MKTLFYKLIILTLTSALLPATPAGMGNLSPACAEISCLSAPIKITNPQLLRVFSQTIRPKALDNAGEINELPMPKGKKFLLACGAVLAAEIIACAFNIVPAAYADSFYAAIFSLNLALPVILAANRNLLAPGSLIPVLPISKIMSNKLMAGSILIDPAEQKPAVAAEFLDHAKNSRFEWALSIGKQKRTLLNLITQGRMMEVKHNFWGHLVFAFRGVNTTAVLHTHPFHRYARQADFFPSPDDFANIGKIKNEINADNYLLSFPEKDAPLLLRFTRSSGGKNLVTQFVFGRKNVLAVLCAALSGKSFSEIAREIPDAVIALEVEAIWKEDKNLLYSLELSAMPADRAKLAPLLEWEKNNRQETPASRTPSLAVSKKPVFQFIPDLSAYSEQFPREQAALNFSI